MDKLKKTQYKAVDVAIKLYGAKKSTIKGFVFVNSILIDLTASGDEDWQVAKNIIRQLAN